MKAKQPGFISERGTFIDFDREVDSLEFREAQLSTKRQNPSLSPQQLREVALAKLFYSIGADHGSGGCDHEST